MSVLAGSILGVVGAGLGVWGYFRMKSTNLIKSTPTSKIANISSGTVEVKGQAAANQYLTTPFSKKKVIAYRYEVHVIKKEQRETGPAKMHWERAGYNERSEPFWVQDDTGSAIVYPEGAEWILDGRKSYVQRRGFSLNGMMKMLKTWDRGQDVDFSKTNLEEVEVGNRSTFMKGYVEGDRMYTEEFIEAGEEVYVLGNAARQDETPMINKGDGPLIISNKSEDEVFRAMNTSNMILLVVAGILIVGGILLAVLT